MDDFVVEGNICFNSGEISKTSGFKYNILAGGKTLVGQRLQLSNNYAYWPKNDRGVDVGYDEGFNDVQINDNVFIGGVILEGTAGVTNVQMNNNKIGGELDGFDSTTYPNNDYYAMASLPNENWVFLRPNKFDPIRSHVVIYNFKNLDKVEVDVSSVLQKGDCYLVKDSENFFSNAVLKGKYKGKPLKIPMDLKGVSKIQGEIGMDITHTKMEFGAYIILKQCKDTYLDNSVDYFTAVIIASTLSVAFCVVFLCVIFCMVAIVVASAFIGRKGGGYKEKL